MTMEHGEEFCVCEFLAKFKEKENIDDDPEEPYQFEVDKKLDAKFPNGKKYSCLC